jgi:hypothetical protein
VEVIHAFFLFPIERMAFEFVALLIKELNCLQVGMGDVVMILSGDTNNRRYISSEK